MNRNEEILDALGIPQPLWATIIHKANEWSSTSLRGYAEFDDLFQDCAIDVSEVVASGKEINASYTGDICDSTCGKQYDKFRAQKGFMESRTSSPKADLETDSEIEKMARQEKQLRREVNELFMSETPKPDVERVADNTIDDDSPENRLIAKEATMEAARQLGIDQYDVEVAHDIDGRAAETLTFKQMLIRVRLTKSIADVEMWGVANPRNVNQKKTLLKEAQE